MKNPGKEVHIQKTAMLRHGLDLQAGGKQKSGCQPHPLQSVSIWPVSLFFEYLYEKRERI